MSAMPISSTADACALAASMPQAARAAAQETTMGRGGRCQWQLQKTAECRNDGQVEESFLYLLNAAA